MSRTATARKPAPMIAPGPIDAWVFDLDNTLYPADAGIFPQIDRRIAQFLSRMLGIDPVFASWVQQHYYREHGTTLRGLMLDYQVDPIDFLDYIHRIDTDVLTPDPALDAALERLPGRKLIFTNGTARHAGNVLTRLGIGRHFDAVFDIVATDFRPKPMPESYRRMMACHGIDPKSAAMVEDIPKNLIPAAELGMTCVLVSGNADLARQDIGHVHHVVDDLAGWLDRAGRAARSGA